MQTVQQGKASLETLSSRALGIVARLRHWRKWSLPQSKMEGGGISVRKAVVSG